MLPVVVGSFDLSQWFWGHIDHLCEEVHVGNIFRGINYFAGYVIWIIVYWLDRSVTLHALVYSGNCAR